MMNGSDIKKAAINKAKQVAQAANGNGGKKRRKGQASRLPCTRLRPRHRLTGCAGSKAHHHHRAAEEPGSLARLPGLLSLQVRLPLNTA